MNTSHPAALAAAILAVCFATGPRLAAQSTDPSIPVGALSAYPTIVQAGTHPVLTWGIDYPQVATDIVTIEDDNTVVVKEDVVMDVRIIGAAVQFGTDRYGRPLWGTVDAQVKADGATSWTRVFYNTHPNVNPTQVVCTKAVRKGYPVDIRGRVSYNGTSYSYYATGTTTRNVIALVHGDYPPAYAPAYSQGSVKSFLQPYLDASGRISIGPKDVIYLFELYTSNTSSPYFDMQDLVVLVTFRTTSNSTQTNYAGTVGATTPTIDGFVYPTDGPSLGE